MKWISIKKQTPPNEDQIIVNNHVPGAEEVNVVICATYQDGRFYNLEMWGNNDPEENRLIEIKHVSHWAKLLEPPTDEMF